MVYVLAGLHKVAGVMFAVGGGGPLHTLAAVIGLITTLYVAWLLVWPKRATDGRLSNSLSILFLSAALLAASVLIDSLLGHAGGAAKYAVLLGAVAISATLYLSSHRQKQIFLHFTRLIAAIRGRQPYENYDPLDEEAARALREIEDPERRLEAAGKYRRARDGEEE